MFVPDEKLRKMQLKCVDILSVIDEICDLNNIEYSLCAGSVIGAYLYKGVIPWDDDVDIMMTRENYEKFLSVCKDYLPENLELVNYKSRKDWTIFFSKIVDKNTTVVETNQEGKELIGGVFVDITVLDKVPIGVTGFFFRIKTYLMLRALTLTFYSDSNGMKGKIKNIIVNKLRKIDRKSLCEELELYIKKYQCRGNYGWAELLTWGKNTLIYPKNIFETYTTIEFEKKTFRIVNKYKEYLKLMYNKDTYDCPENEQIPHHFKYINLDLPYEKYYNAE